MRFTFTHYLGKQKGFVAGNGEYFRVYKYLNDDDCESETIALFQDQNKAQEFVAFADSLGETLWIEECFLADLFGVKD